MAETAEIAAEIAALHDWITRAAEALAAEEEVDLSGLDARVGRLCARVDALPEADTAALRPRLTAMLAEMDRLQANLRTQHESLRGQLQDHGRRSAAARAYNRAPGRGGPRT